ncbi:MAG: alkaline shock response membrane anchor protein AmaP [Verrucomicrobiota bacterium]
MERRSGNLGNFAMTLLLLLVGSLLIYGNMFNREVGEFMARLLVMPWIGAALGAVLILSVLLRWVGGCGRKKGSFIDFHSDDGSVGISTKAIQDFIERVGKEFSAVKSIESRLLQKKGAVDIVLSVKVVSGNKIPELSHVLQQRIRESVRESLGLEEIRNITIKVQEIVGDPAKAAVEPALDGE